MKKLTYIFLTATLLLAGCFKQEEPIPEPPPTDKTLTILDLKEKYNEQDDKTILPLYNVSPTEIFEFSFNSYLGDLSVHDIITVHTDPNTSDTSIIDTHITPESYNIGPTTLRVKPKEGLLKPSENTWGIAPIYYIRVNYDMDTQTPTKLENPIIIPFTIKSPVPTPEVTLSYNSEGVAALTWQPIEGATNYKIYNLTKQTLTNNDSEDLTSIKTAFKGYTLYEIGQSTETTFSDWASNHTDGIIKKADGTPSLINQGMNGDYFVTAVINNQESIASNIVSTNSIYNEISTGVVESLTDTIFETTNALPKTIKVQLVNQKKLTDKEISYHTDNITITENEPITIPYSIPTTPFTGTVIVEKATQSDLQALHQATAYEAVPGVKLLKNNTTQTPPPNLPTVLEISEDSTEVVKVEDETESEGVEDETNTEQEEPDQKPELLNSKSLITQQKTLTEKQIEQANQQTIIEPSYFQVENFQLNTDTAFEEYIALSLLNHETEISLKAFPSYQGYHTLSEAFEKVVYQNPILSDTLEWEYNYETQQLNITYTETKLDPHVLIKQAKILLYGKFEEREVTSKNGKKTTIETVEVEKGILSPDMSEEDKQLTIYNYLVEHIGQGVEPENGLTVHDVLFNKQGSPKSLTNTFKLLTDLANIPTLTITGVSNGKPHLWNKVSINNNWLNVDLSKNIQTTGVPYMVYNMSDAEAQRTALIPDKRFSQYTGVDESQDYYARNSLTVNNTNDYYEKLTKKLEQGETYITFRTTTKLDTQTVYDLTGKALQQYTPEKLATSKFGERGNYIIITTEDPNAEPEETTNEQEEGEK